MASAAQVAKVLKKPGEDNDVEVTWEDQQRINTFGKLNNRLAELKAKHALKKVPSNTSPPFLLLTPSPSLTQHRRTSRPWRTRPTRSCLPTTRTQARSCAFCCLFCGGGGAHVFPHPVVGLRLGTRTSSSTRTASRTSCKSTAARSTRRSGR